MLSIYDFGELRCVRQMVPDLTNSQRVEWSSVLFEHFRVAY